MIAVDHRRSSRPVAVVIAAGGVTALAWSLGGGLTDEARITSCVFACAIALWTLGGLDDTFVAVGAAVALVLMGVVEDDALFASLGDSTVWLLIGSFVVAAAATSSGLTARLTDRALRGASTVRGVAHRAALALSLTTFAVPATSGRAALALPVFVALSRRIAEPRVSRALSLVFPTAILLSAAASLLGAGAHLIAAEILATMTGESIGFLKWLLLGLPFAAVSTAVSTWLILRIFLTQSERNLAVARQRTGRSSLSAREWLVLVVLVGQIGLWATESLHGWDPALVAIVGAIVVSAPGIGSLTVSRALDDIPWSLLVFLAATLVLGDAIVSSGAATALVGGALESLGPGTPPAAVVAAVAGLGLVAHLVVGSRSARSTVLTPLVVLAAAPLGVQPAALVFLATVAAGYCLTLTSSAKPVAIFAASGEPVYAPRDLQRLSAVLIPVHAALLVAFALWIWPLLGLPLT